jgi:hypothetical protein
MPGVPRIKGYVRATPAKAPHYPVNVSGGIVDWGMLGNGPDPMLTVNGGQPVGDCTYAGRQHVKMAKAAAGHLSEAWETSNQLVTEYLAHNGGQDTGDNISDLLLHWYQIGRILGYGALDHTNKIEVDWSCQTFHGVYAGVSLTDDADQRFENHQVWDISPDNQPDPSQGHCIVKVKATPTTDTWVTWGGLQDSTAAWTAACMDEAYVIITPEDLHATNLDIAALRYDLDGLAQAHGQSAGAVSQSLLGRITSCFKK